MAYLSSDLISSLKSRINLYSLINNAIPLKKVTKNKDNKTITACCPFHNDKTPSFRIDEDLGRYHCFGCNEKGDAIDFLMDHLRMDFISSVKEICSLTGVDFNSLTKQSNDIGNIPTTHQDSDDAHSYSRFLLKKSILIKSDINNPNTHNFASDNILIKMGNISEIAESIKSKPELLKAVKSTGAITDGKFKLYSNKTHLPMFRLESINSDDDAALIFAHNSRLKGLMPVGFYVLDNHLNFESIYPPLAKNEASALLMTKSSIHSKSIYIVDTPDDYLALCSMGINNIVCPATCSLNVSHLKQLSELTAKNIVWITNRSSINSDSILTRLCMFDESLTKNKSFKFVFLKEGIFVSSLINKYQQKNLDFLESKQIAFFDLMLQAVQGYRSSGTSITDLTAKTIESYLNKLLLNDETSEQFDMLISEYSQIKNIRVIDALLRISKLDSKLFYSELEKLNDTKTNELVIDYSLVYSAKTPEHQQALAHHLLMKNQPLEAVTKCVLHSNNAQCQILKKIHHCLNGSFTNDLSDTKSTHLQTSLSS